MEWSEIIDEIIKNAGLEKATYGEQLEAVYKYIGSNENRFLVKGEGYLYFGIYAWAV